MTGVHWVQLLWGTGDVTVRACGVQAESGYLGHLGAAQTLEFLIQEGRPHCPPGVHPGPGCLGHHHPPLLPHGAGQGGLQTVLSEKPEVCLGNQTSLLSYIFAHLGTVSLPLLFLLVLDPQFQLNNLWLAISGSHSEVFICPDQRF